MGRTSHDCGLVACNLTEFENAFLPPAGGNVCFGVWKDLGDYRAKLHHIGLMFNPDGSLSSIFTVDEKDTVSSDGKTYEGMFDFSSGLPVTMPSARERQ